MNSIAFLITCLTHLIMKKMVTVFGDHVSADATLSVFGQKLQFGKQHSDLCFVQVLYFSLSFSFLSLKWMIIVTSQSDFVY